MQSSHSGDRRKNTQQTSFPLADKEGHIIRAERRSGKDRRKNKRRHNVANEILNIIH